ncbi:hypothetical protein BCIN_08g05980 [Botrytis cinerea B05.10]|uniref:Uncharacterized protein n=1 Tax=Botryotinia fuckeliana (strain B05.10) TaxID=332648 RepID=A0A384JR23_BOTFB|nr:hypothetical protein BCIN_08g05980 [Botrytis cinerea B05.10]ATZ52983.1 hypothetical protein BCIN_08g05980 [Botrytis cinerea B05.10]
MCFANRNRCKRCNKETIQYVSKCQQYPNVTTETATHAIRGRHRRIRSCKECRRTERRRAEEEAALTTVHHQQAKAIIEWQRLERPLPLSDEAIATRYGDLYLDGERLHPYCVGFTDIHRDYMAAHRRELAARSKKIQEALNEVEFELTVDELEIVAMIFSEDAMFDECIQRQAEIDSGARTMTETDRDFSFHEVGTIRNFNRAMVTIKSAARRNNFGTWTVDVPDRYVAEDRIRREIIAYIAALEEANAEDDRIDKFTNQVLNEFKKEEETFDFDPKTCSLKSEVPVWGRVDDRKTFCEWKNHCQQSSKKLEGKFDRWYTLINQYRKYLMIVSPAQATLFSIARNKIASRMFRALTGRPEPVPLVKVPEPATPELQSQETHDNELSSLDLDDYLDTDSEDDGCDMALSDTEDDDDESNGVEMTPARQRLQQSLSGLEQLVQISNGFIRDLPEQSNTGAAYLQQCIRFLNDQLASNSYPTGAEWEIVAQYTANAMEMLNHLNDERNARAASRQAESPGAWREPTQEPEPFLVDLTPMELGIMEEEPDSIAHGRRHILGLSSPLRAYEWRLEEEGSEDGNVWRGEMYDEDEDEEYF